MHRTSFLCLLLVAGFGSWITACSESAAPVACSDIGCFSGLTVFLEEPLPEGAVVSLLLGSTPWAATCGQDVDGTEVLYFEDLRSDRLAIRVITPTAEADFNFRPEYSLSRPKGPDCPPKCFHAEITLPAMDQT